jgi:hypothetical protein
MSFSALSEWLLSLAFILAFAAVGEAGFRIGRKSAARGATKTMSEISAVEGGILALLGLMLGFTMSMAVTRFEARKQLLLDESNAIGTSYRRAQLLPAAESANVRSLLLQYVNVRLQYGNAGDDSDRIKATLEQAHRLQDEIWIRAVSYAQEDPNPAKAGLLLQSLNQVIDLEASRWMAFQDHVPITVICVNFVLALLAALFVGFTYGLEGRRQILATCVLTLAVTTALVVIIDLDSPRNGLIRNGQQPMIDLQHQMLISEN